jgi:hypothetical protein
MLPVLLFSRAKVPSSYRKVLEKPTKLPIDANRRWQIGAAADADIFSNASQ